MATVTLQIATCNIRISHAPSKYTCSAVLDDLLHMYMSFPVRLRDTILFHEDPSKVGRRVRPRHVHSHFSTAGHLAQCPPASDSQHMLSRLSNAVHHRYPPTSPTHLPTRATTPPLLYQDFHELPRYDAVCSRAVAPHTTLLHIVHVWCSCSSSVCRAVLGVSDSLVTTWTCPCWSESVHST
ncbi:hypothetical protein T440DRAFT_252930 [Plenodomus tracheiphilus IPT5]|uniref:Uncharacterized protein n=1 Tax=Plenodomus tracheiphilus IPT5 TaxID=1408161 RepID=A0A6A7AUB2_9PLEO|nr:hypothetical protein T440DRAFT_252930 [Plenodomus tracheiphilus IPT5]